MLYGTLQTNTLNKPATEKPDSTATKTGTAFLRQQLNLTALLRLFLCCSLKFPYSYLAYLELTPLRNLNLVNLNLSQLQLLAHLADWYIPFANCFCRHFFQTRARCIDPKWLCSNLPNCSYSVFIASCPMANFKRFSLISRSTFFLAFSFCWEKVKPRPKKKAPLGN